MNKRGRGYALWMVASLLLIVALPASASAKGHRITTIGSHHFSLSGNGPAFEITNLGILSFKLLINQDGSLKIARGTGPGPTPCLRLLDPKAQLPGATLKGLLKLAEAEGFFSMPGVIKSSGRNVDLLPQSITIHTTAGAKTVVMNPPATDPQFNQLHAVLRAAAGLTLNCGQHARR